MNSHFPIPWLEEILKFALCLLEFFSTLFELGPIQCVSFQMSPQFEEKV